MCDSKTHLNYIDLLLKIVKMLGKQMFVDDKYGKEEEK